MPNATVGLAELRTRLLPFLRQAALVMHAHFNVAPSLASSDSQAATSEFDKLCTFLRLSPELSKSVDFNDSVYSKLISGWCFMWHNSDRKPSSSSPVVQNIGEDNPFQ